MLLMAPILRKIVSAVAIIWAHYAVTGWHLMRTSGSKAGTCRNLIKLKHFHSSLICWLLKPVLLRWLKTNKKTNFIHQQNDKGKLETTKVSKVVFLFFLNDSGTSAADITENMKTDQEKQKREKGDYLTSAHRWWAGWSIEWEHFAAILNSHLNHDEAWKLDSKVYCVQHSVFTVGIVCTRWQFCSC